MIIIRFKDYVIVMGTVCFHPFRPGAFSADVIRRSGPPADNLPYRMPEIGIGGILSVIQFPVAVKVVPGVKANRCPGGDQRTVIGMLIRAENRNRFWRMADNFPELVPDFRPPWELRDGKSTSNCC